jgi:hypothetical protein
LKTYKIDGAQHLKGAKAVANFQSGSILGPNASSIWRFFEESALFGVT